MRRFNNILTAAALSVLTLIQTGCVKETMSGTSGVGRVPLSEFELGFQAEQAQLITRTGQNTEVENNVENLYVLLFDQEGKIVRSRKYSVSNTTNVPEGYDDVINSYSIRQDENDGLSKGVIPRFFEGFIETERLGQDMTFYAVANYPERLAEQLDSVDDAAELESMTFSFPEEGNVERSSFLMVARHTGISLSVENGTVGRIGVNLLLRRVDAKITFRLSVEIPEADPGSTSFTGMTYRVHNVPDITYLFEKDRDASSLKNQWDAAAQNPEKGYSCMLNDNYQTFDEENPDGSGGTFSFYLRENRPVVTNPITKSEKGDFSTLYAMREAWDGTKESSVHGRNFIYAPEKSTFVEINGVLNYTRTSSDGNTDRVYGKVTYLVHLGETGSDPDNENFVNNYDVRRNVRYIYNMRITGINSFVVEVGQSGTEVRPGAEGNIVITDDRLISLDAHYGRFLLILNRQTLTDDAAWNTFSPIHNTLNGGRTAYDPESGLINAPYDYKWVLFAVNKNFGQDNKTKMVKYPGVQAYDGGVSFFDENGNPRSDADLKKLIADDTGNRFEGGHTFKDMLEQRVYPDNYYATRTGQLSEHACLMDVNQLVKYLVQEAKNPDSELFDQDGEVAITGFCDEYTYIYNPAEENYIHPGFSIREEFSGNTEEQRKRLALWKKYVDAGDRVMSITPLATTSYSPDGNTSLTNSFVTISQNSIKTIYNPDRVETAWGLEIKNETGRLGWEVPNADRRLQTGKRPNTISDGRTNFLNFLVRDDGKGEYRWTDAMTTELEIESADGLNDDYRNAFYACITRNRDLNGNNLIDADEIFWYLAARDQLSGLWIGQFALENNAWLYTEDMYSDTEVKRNHFITSSYSGNGDTYNKRFWILWAEEGSSFGHLRQSGDDKTEPAVYDYRCVRNLGIDIADQQAPTHYATISEKNNSGDYPYYTIDVGAINSRSLRSSTDEVSLPYDNERSQNNRPYAKFDVMADNYGGIRKMNDIRNDIQKNLNPCPKGWRIPTQREFAIMTGFKDQNGFNLDTYGVGGLAIATSFSFAGIGEFESDRDMFYYDGNLRLKDSGENPEITVRCVRDHTGD